MESFAELLKLREAFKEFKGGWFICGGWAIDLFCEGATRPHNDIDIGVFRKDQIALQASLKDWSLTFLENGKAYSWPEKKFLPLPIHQVMARKGKDILEILLNEEKEDHWLYRRDPRITLPISKIIHTSKTSGLRYLAPEAVLLYKSKHRGEKDLKDLKNSLPLMTADQKTWLINALKLTDPINPWIKLL